MDLFRMEKQEDSRLDYSYYALEATLKPYPPEI